MVQCNKPDWLIDWLLAQTLRALGLNCSVWNISLFLSPIQMDELSQAFSKLSKTHMYFVYRRKRVTWRVEDLVQFIDNLRQQFLLFSTHRFTCGELRRILLFCRRLSLHVRYTIRKFLSGFWWYFGVAGTKGVERTNGLYIGHCSLVYGSETFRILTLKRLAAGDSWRLP